MRFEPFMRTLDLLMIAMLVGMVAWTFKIKHDSQVALDRVSELEALVTAKKIEIDLLKSDWSLLTNPARLEQMAERYGSELGLKPIDPSQLTNLDLLPPVRQQFDPQQLQDDFASSPDDLLTGSIKPLDGGMSNGQ
jgi:hypothetical protein